MNLFFDRIVVANLARRPDRLAAAKAQFTSPAWPFIAPHVFVSADGMQNPPPAGWNGTAGDWGNLQTHAAITRHAVAAGYCALLILEDDFILTPGFAAKVSDFLAFVPRDWDGIALGGNHCRPPTLKGAGVVQCVKSSENHAYAVRGGLLKALSEAYGAGDASAGTIWPEMQARFRVYAPSRWLIGQSAGQSDVSKSGGNKPERFYDHALPISPIASSPNQHRFTPTHL